jgi:hypothetical protein
MQSTVRGLVIQFIAAFNKGDVHRLSHIFARSDFGWYSTDGPGARLGAEAYDRDTLLGYFMRRHKFRERLRLRSFKFNGNSQGYGNFEYGLVRRAQDLKPTEYYGKGAAVCRTWPGSPAIAVWSMGRRG